MAVVLDKTADEEYEQLLEEWKADNEKWRTAFDEWQARTARQLADQNDGDAPQLAPEPSGE